jgi:hypothetical protein
VLGGRVLEAHATIKKPTRVDSLPRSASFAQSSLLRFSRSPSVGSFFVCPDSLSLVTNSLFFRSSPDPGIPYAFQTWKMGSPSKQVISSRREGSSVASSNSLSCVSAMLVACPHSCFRTCSGRFSLWLFCHLYQFPLLSTSGCNRKSYGSQAVSLVRRRNWAFIPILLLPTM